ncbi:MAG TPA: tetratricopeptide repeat protein [Candidatus Limnocylindrales bacterium]|nr:tetratricopeptide repeat protein [Candidatus Limnocylindrales bacterium]
MLLDNAEPSAAIAAISGPPGVGKTALAVRWARGAAERFPDGQLYVDLHGYDPMRPVSVNDAVAMLLRGLGMPREAIAAEVDERAAQYRTALARRQMLIVLDNARDSEHVRMLLPGSSLCRTLVTSRERLSGIIALSGARAMEVSPLRHDHSVQLLDALIGARAAREQDISDLAAACGGLPLALRVAAELATRRDESIISRLVAELSDVDRRLEVLMVGNDQQSTVREVLSWSYRNLDDKAAQLFRLLGVQPGNEVSLDAAAALMAADRLATQKLVDLLHQANLIEMPYSGRYAMHDLLRAYACELATSMDSSAEIHRALERLGGHYVQLSELIVSAASAPADTSPASTAAVSARERLSQDLPNIVLMAGHAASHLMPRIAIQLSDVLARQLFVSAYYDSAAAIHTHALDAAQSTGDQQAEADASQHLSAIYRRWGRYDDSYARAARALDLYQQCGCKAGQGMAHKSLGLLHQRQGRYDAAETHHHQALKIAQELGDRISEANTLGNLAIVYDLSGRYKPAAEQFDQALAVFRELGDRVGEGRTLDNLGIIFQREGQYRRALGLHEQALELMRETGDHAGEGATLDNIASAHRQTGDLKQARKFMLQSLAVRQKCQDRAGEGTNLYGLGSIHELSNNLAEARINYEQAIQIADELGDRHLRANALYGLGQVARKSGHLQLSHDHYDAALALATTLGDAEYQAHALHGLGKLMISLGKTDLARRHLNDALFIYGSRNMPEADQVLRQLSNIDRQ